MIITPLDIEDLLYAKEGERCQFKEAKNKFEFDEAARCCCALANCGGGKLVFGITDKRPRKVVGSNAFEQPERTRRGLIDKLKVMVDFYLLFQDDKRVLVFEVSSHPVGIPVQLDGIAWFYESDSLIPLPEKERRRIYEELNIDFSAMICSGATISDLEESAIDVFRTKWIEKSGNQRLKNLSIEQILFDCEAISNEGVTFAALIMFGKKESLRKYLPQAEIVYEYRSTNASGPANSRAELRMGFFSCYSLLWDMINLRNDVQHYQEGFFVFDIPTFNENVVREAVLNAVSHRNYQLAGSVFIRQYPDRLRVESPGGFPAGVTLDTILDRQVPRNRRIAEILSLCGLVERSGQGMNIMFETSIKEAKQLPDFSGTDGSCVVLTLNGLVIDKQMLSVINRIGNDRMEKLTTTDFLVVNSLYKGLPLKDYMKPYLQHLTELGIIEHIGRNRYVLARSLYIAAGKTGTHTRKVGLDRETNKELLVKHMKSKGKEGTPFKEFQQVLPGLNRGQIQVLLRELRKENRTYCIGNTNGARWFWGTKPLEE